MKKNKQLTRKPWCPLCGTKHAVGKGPAGYSCERGH